MLADDMSFDYGTLLVALRLVELKEAVHTEELQTILQSCPRFSKVAEHRPRRKLKKPSDLCDVFKKDCST